MSLSISAQNAPDTAHISAVQVPLASHVSGPIQPPCENVSNSVPCWADSVPEEFATPTFKGLTPPEPHVPASNICLDDLVGTAAARPVLSPSSGPSDHSSSCEDELRSPHRRSSVASSKSSTRSVPLPTSFTEFQAGTDASKDDLMLVWYSYVAGWAYDFGKAKKAQVPPPPPPPDMTLPAGRRPYNMEVWCRGLQRWYATVSAEYTEWEKTSAPPSCACSQCSRRSTPVPTSSPNPYENRSVPQSPLSLKTPTPVRYAPTHSITTSPSTQHVMYFGF